MEMIMKLLIGLCCVLIVFVGTVSLFFLKYRPPHHSSFVKPNGSAGSSSRSRMAARWAHMGHGSNRGRDNSHIDDDQQDNDSMDHCTKQNPSQCDVEPDDFGRSGKLAGSHRARSQASLPSSLVGTGPNGSRTLLMGWFGLDEPTSAGYNTRVEPKEKTLDGDMLPMRATNGTDLEDSYQHQSVAPLRRVPTTEDHDWETRSEISGV